MLNNLLKVTKNVISKCVKPVLESAKKAFQPQINNLKKSTLGKVAAKILPVVNSPTVKSGFSQVQKALALPKVVAPAKKESAPPPQISTNNQAKQLSASSNSPAPQEENVKLLEQYKGTESSLLEDIIRGAVKSDAGHIIFKGDLDSPAMQGFFAMLRTVTSPGFKNTGLKAPYEELKAVIKDKFNEVGNDVYNAHIPIASNFIGAFTNSSDYKQQGPLPLESEKTNHLLAILHYSMYADKAGGTLNHADALTTYQNMVSNTNMASVIGANAGGALISGGAGMVDSIIETVLDPYEFQKNLLNLVVNSPVIIPTLLKEIEDYSKHYVYEASPQEKARVKGRIVFELASLAVLSAIGKASKGAETSQGVQKTEEMVKNGSKASALVDEGGVSITKTEDVLAANRGVGEVVEEGAKKGTGNAGKTGEAIEGTGKGISEADKAKISGWQYPPSEELYLKNKKVYDNPKYFDQKSGNAIYPGMNGDPNIGGFTNGINKTKTLTPGQIIDRYGSNGTGQYFSPGGSSFESRALPPFMETQPYTQYEVLKPFEVKSGEIAPWFGQSGKGIQYYSDIEIIDSLGNSVKATVQTLIDEGYIGKISH